MKINIWKQQQLNFASDHGVCEQQTRRPACASIQTNQGHCFSLFVQFIIKTCYKRKFNFVASLRLSVAENMFLKGYPLEAKTTPKN